ncbi:D-alanine--D-alanine ligase [Gammaproteobacteria bacterium]|nr:D-alanine--D-alanine ligase [Gammaproteobacteria bacterium]
MNSTDKIRVAVLYGGRSGEHEISLLSATNVIKGLDRTMFDVLPIGIDKQGSWFLGDDLFNKELNESEVLRLQCGDDRMLFDPELIVQSKPFQKNLSILANSDISRQKLFDVIFPVIHGPMCEDGTVQGLLELVEVPYVGCGVLSSSINMDKDISKRLAKSAGINTPQYLVIKCGMWDKDPDNFCEKVDTTLNFPVFVKPVNTGSSVGIHKVKTKNDLVNAINDAFNYDTKVIVEQGLDILEIEVAVLESLDPSEEPLVSMPGEVKPSSDHDFYSYDSKYKDENGAELVIPANIPQNIQDQVRDVAKNIFKVLECEGMARVDLFLERKTNKIYFNEVNTIPGFTKISMYPKLMEASGVEYSKLLTHLIMLAMQKHTKKEKLSREYVEA